MKPCIKAAGGSVAAELVTEDAFNSFPKLPVREDERVFVWGVWFDNAEAEARFSRKLSAQGGWRDDAPEAVLPALMRKPEVLRLEPAGKVEARAQENESSTRRSSGSQPMRRQGLFQVRATF